MYRWIIRIEGGLGNQLFQYAHARALQLKFGGRILLDLHAFNSKQTRHLSLFNYVLNDSVETCRGAYKLRLYYLAFVKKILDRIKMPDCAEDYVQRVARGLYCQYQTRYFDSLVIPQRKTNYVVGNWMSGKFFEDYKEIIKKELSVRWPVSHQCLDVERRIRKTESVCVHIRLGDYLTEPWKSKLFLCDNDYYNKAMQLIAARVQNPIFYVFSNSHKDFEMIQRDYRFDFPVEYVDLGNADYEDLRLMSLCKHNIMSNSTYSWWSQYLNDYGAKIVVAPSRFNNYPHWDMTDIYMPEWNLIEI